MIDVRHLETLKYLGPFYENTVGKADDSSNICWKFTLLLVE